MPDNDDKAARKTTGPRKAAKKTAAKKAGAKKSSAPRKAAVKKPASSPRARAAAAGPTHEQIAERAYQIHEAEGGDHEQNWLRAERELRGQG